MAGTRESGLSDLPIIGIKCAMRRGREGEGLYLLERSPSYDGDSSSRPRRASAHYTLDGSAYISAESRGNRWQHSHAQMVIRFLLATVRSCHFPEPPRLSASVNLTARSHGGFIRGHNKLSLLLRLSRPLSSFFFSPP